MLDTKGVVEGPKEGLWVPRTPQTLWWKDQWFPKYLRERNFRNAREIGEDVGY